MKVAFIVFEPKSGAWDGFYLQSSSASSAAKSLAKRFPKKDWFVIKVFPDEYKHYKAEKLWWNVLKEGEKK